MDNFEEPLNGERLEITLNITQASSLYVIANNAIHMYKKLHSDLLEVIKTDNSEELRDTLMLYKAIIKDAEFLKSEAAEIVQELDGKPETKIIKPKWSQR